MFGANLGCVFKNLYQFFKKYKYGYERGIAAGFNAVPSSLPKSVMLTLMVAAAVAVAAVQASTAVMPPCTYDGRVSWDGLRWC